MQWNTAGYVSALARRLDHGGDSRSGAYANEFPLFSSAEIDDRGYADVAAGLFRITPGHIVDAVTTKQASPP